MHFTSIIIRLIRNLLLGALITFLLIQLIIVFVLSYWKFYPITNSMFMLSYQITDNNPPIQHQWVDNKNISAYIKKAVIVAEDSHFFKHQGLDWNRIKRAFKINKKHNRIIAGGSTITQQLAKNLFLFKEKSYLRKIQEILITFYIESMWSKNRILEVYLNVIEFGKGIYGIGAASNYYYAISPKQLNLYQSVYLAAILPNPTYYQQHPKNKKFNLHKNRIIREIHHTVLK